MLGKKIQKEDDCAPFMKTSWLVSYLNMQFIIKWCARQQRG